jgi:hypothetical protein
MTVRLPAIRAGRSLTHRKIPGTHFCLRLSRPQAIMRLEGIGQLKKSNDLIKDRSRDLPACSIVHQPSTPPRTPYNVVHIIQTLDLKVIYTSITVSALSVRPSPISGRAV